MKYIIHSIVAFAICAITFSCVDENKLPDNTQEDIEISLNEVLTEWGMSYDAVIAHMNGYESHEVSDDNVLHFSNSKLDVAYRFHNKQLCATIVILNANILIDHMSLLLDYVYLGDLDGCSIYEDLKYNTMASVWEDKDCRIIGFTPIQSSAYEKVEPISAITGECLNITTSTAELCGSVKGLNEIAEVGFIYGTTMDLTERTATKISTTSEGDFSINISDLYDETQYYYCAYVVFDGIYYLGDIKDFVTEESNFDDPLDLATAGSSNCYIVSKRGTYKFPTVKGNKNESVGSVYNAVVLWETFGTNEEPEVGALIKKVIYENGCVLFKTNSTFREGNAVIAVMDIQGNILWSWHIWLTEQPAIHIYYNNSGIFMDRNLGATSASPGGIGTLGLLYQWGRKDPFLNTCLRTPISCEYSSEYIAKSTIIWPAPVSSNINNGTIAFSISNPTTFIIANSNNNDWYYTNTRTTEKNRWKVSTKTIYDPCPPGWRVPDGGFLEKATRIGRDDYPYDSENAGIDFSGILGNGETIWYPASGYRFEDGWLYNSNVYGAYWTNETIITNSRWEYGENLFFYDDGHTNGSYILDKAFGCSVRCVKE